MDTHQTPDKPFRTYEEMVDYLQKVHHLRFIDPDWAISALHLVPYYDLINGYKDLFMENDIFKENVTFEYLYLFHTFDHRLQNVLFENSIVVEDYFKNNLAYLMAKDFGVSISDYLSPRNYVSARGAITFRNVNHTISNVYANQNLSHINEPTRHYLLHHNHIPPWILLKNVTFSNAIKLFYLMKSPQKEELSNVLIPQDIPVHQKIQLAYYTLTVIRKFRNVIAHNLKFISFNCRIYSRGLDIRSFKNFVPNELLTWRDLHHRVGLYDIYSYIVLSMAFLLDSTEKELLIKNLSGFLTNFLSTTNPTPALIFHDYCAFTHMPADILTRLESYAKTVAKNTPRPTAHPW